MEDVGSGMLALVTRTIVASPVLRKLATMEAAAQGRGFKTDEMLNLAQWLGNVHMERIR